MLVDFRQNRLQVDGLQRACQRRILELQIPFVCRRKMALLRAAGAGLLALLFTNLVVATCGSRLLLVSDLLTSHTARGFHNQAKRALNAATQSAAIFVVKVPEQVF